MPTLETIADHIHDTFEARTAARDKALSQARTLTRHCAHAIRAIHREEPELVGQHLEEARKLVHGLCANLSEYPDLYYAGYTQDALKEYAEAVLVQALVEALPLPGPEELELEPATYLQGLAEAASELRRRCLDLMLNDHQDEAVRLLRQMDDIYAILVTMDYPDAITGGIRRLTDLVRGVTERTRGDLTLSLRQTRLEKSLKEFEQRIGP